MYGAGEPPHPVVTALSVIFGSIAGLAVRVAGVFACGSQRQRSGRTGVRIVRHRRNSDLVRRRADRNDQRVSVAHALLRRSRRVGSSGPAVARDHTLQRHSTTSPSCITYSLPSERSLPALRIASIVLYAT